MSNLNLFVNSIGFVFYELDDLAEIVAGSTLKLVPHVVPDQSLLLGAIAADIMALRLEGPKKGAYVPAAAVVPPEVAEKAAKVATKLRELRRKRINALKNQAQNAKGLKEEVKYAAFLFTHTHTHTQKQIFISSFFFCSTLKSSWLSFEKQMKGDFTKAVRMAQKTKVAIQHVRTYFFFFIYFFFVCCQVCSLFFFLSKLRWARRVSLPKSVKRCCHSRARSSMCLELSLD